MTATPQTPPTDQPLTAGDIDWSAPLPDALWSHFNSTYGLSREEASEAAGEVLDIIAQQSARPATSAASEGATQPDTVFGHVFETLRNGAPGLSEITRVALARSVSMKVRATTALASPPVSERERELEGFGQRRNLELSYRYADEDEDGDGAWQVHQVNGGINDREWTLIGSGQTPADAIHAALTAQPAGEGK